MYVVANTVTLSQQKLRKQNNILGFLKASLGYHYPDQNFSCNILLVDVEENKSDQKEIWQNELLVDVRGTVTGGQRTIVSRATDLQVA